MLSHPRTATVNNLVTQTSIGIKHVKVSEDRTICMVSGTGWHASERYGGARSCSVLNMSVTSLNSTCELVKYKTRSSSTANRRSVSLCWKSTYFENVSYQCYVDLVMSNCEVSLQYVHTFRRQVRKCLPTCLFSHLWYLYDTDL